jgi:hypothetical protein
MTFLHPQVHQRIVDSLLQLVEAERGGEAVARPLLKAAVAMLGALRWVTNAGSTWSNAPDTADQ